MLEAMMNRELLNYAAGRAMFCPSCDRILDSDSAVLMTTRDGVNADQCAAITCADCYDELRKRLRGVEEAALLARVEIIDGRRLDG